MAGIISLNSTANQIRGEHNKKTDQASQAAVRISSGTRINKPSVDASSLAISQGIRAKVSLLEQAGRNVSQGAAIMNIALGGLEKIQDTLVMMTALTAKANNELNDDQATAIINTEYQKLLGQIDSIANTTRAGTESLLQGMPSTSAVTFNGATTGITSASLKVLDASGFSGTTASITYTHTPEVTTPTPVAASGAFSLTIGSDTYTGTISAAPGTSDTATVTLSNGGKDLLSFEITENFVFGTSTTVALDVTTTSAASATKNITLQVAENATDTLTIAIQGVNVSNLSLTNTDTLSLANATSSSTKLNDALKSVQNNMASIGAQQLQFESTAANLATAIENNDLTRSAYADADIAEEMGNLTQSKVFADLSARMMSEMFSMQSKIADQLR